MIYLILGLVLLAAFLMAGSALTKIPAAKIAQSARFGSVALLGVLALLLMLTGRFHAVSGVLALAGRALAARAMAGGMGNPFAGPSGFSDINDGAAHSQGGPTIQTQFLEMRLDEVTGAISGHFIAGPYQGQSLAALSQEQLVNAYHAIENDGESVRLLEAYLDRTFASWREDHNQGAGSRGTSATDSGSMGKDEAYQILGLEPGAQAEAIRAAHRRLMANIHPDRGGSTYLAAKVNLAKEVLLKLHG